MSNPRATMLTFAPMIDSETVRLLLRHYAVTYDERDRLFIWAVLSAWFRSGKAAIPLTWGDGFKVTGPYALTQQCDSKLPEAQKLIPTVAPLDTTVAADWTNFNTGLGTAVAVFAYYYLLPQRKLMQPIFAEPIPWYERLLMPIAYPVMNFMFNKALNLTPQNVATSATTIRTIFDQTDQRLSDGRRYLCGDRMTLGDVALAGSAAALLLPPGYGAKMPPVDAMPAEMKLLIHELREHPTAAFVDRLYREWTGAA